MKLAKEKGTIQISMPTNDEHKECEVTREGV